MKKKDLLKIIDNDLLDKLFGFCYVRTKDSCESEELCSDIVYALVKAANGEGEIESPYPFIWRTARNVYADFSQKKRTRSERQYEGDPDDVLPFIADSDSESPFLEAEGEDRELLAAVYRQIAFLTRAYREVMIMYYLDGLSTSEIAVLLGTSEGNIRQRLFSARKKLRNEVETVTANNKPVAFDKVNYNIIGTGNPLTGDPRDGFERQFSKQVLRLCHKKTSNAKEIAEELNVPTMYVEEELEILTRGANGEYGLLRRLDNGKYGVNFVLLDKEQINEAWSVYIDQLPEISGVIIDFIEKNRE
ncbi:MAG: RNA polymerase sigma factor, partial [Ruminiclostridium sp.]|nr:RNA polymerase sigma factor [Ruminiclostridium sp.]